MPSLDLHSLVIEVQNIEDNKYVAYAKWNQLVVCQANFILSNSSLLLNWIETNEKFQGKGIASKVLNSLCEYAISENLGLIINIVNEEVLQNFYFKWFQKKFDPESIYEEVITEKFNILVDDNSSLRLNLSLDDLKWHPANKLQLNP